MPTIALRLEQVGGPPLESRVITLSARLLLGRDREADIVLLDPQVSRQHCRIEQRENETRIVDLDSQIGTLLNDVRLPAGQAVTLNVHDRIRVGPWRFRVRSGFDVLSVDAREKPGHITLSGKTQIASPVLAAERRLELLVEFAAGSSALLDQAALAALTVDFAQRGSNASSVALFASDAGEASPLCQLGATAIPAMADVFAASAKGGIVSFVHAELAMPGLCVALRIDGEAVAQLVLVFADPVLRDKSESAEYLHAMARMSALAWAQLERKGVLLRLDRLRDDLERAREAQSCLLPATAGMINGLCYAYHLQPGRSVAGDLLDVFAISDSQVGIIFGDVSGAGFGAAMLMASVQAYLHAELLETADPQLAAQRANRYAARVGSGRFVTAWIGVFDQRTRTLQAVDAGHGLAWRFAQGSLLQLTLRGGPPLGVDVHAEFDSEQLQLARSERVILLSDGVTEHRAEHAAGGRFDSSLAQHFAQTMAPLAEQPEALFAALERFGGRLPDDDATALFIALAD